MAKRPLLRGKMRKPAAALLLSTLLAAGLGLAAAAEEEVSKQPAPASASTAPEAGDRTGNPAKPSTGDAAEPATGRPTEALMEAKPDDVKPEDAKPVSPPAKPAEASKEQAEPAQPSNVGAGAIPSPKETGDSARAEPEAVKPPKETGPAAVTPPKETKAEAKPADAKPSVPAVSAPKPAEKDAATGVKPRDLTPRTDASGLTVQASSVNAVYHIHWLGAYIGDFKVRSSITNRQYSLQANADISVFFGAVSWQGITSSHGLMTANGPVPQAYSFRYSTSDRHEAIELRFQQRMVQDIIINPPQHPGSRNVPITAADLQNVVDPLSAIILLSQARLSRNNGDACNKRLPIFDGKIRYDLVFSAKGTRAIGNTGKLHGTAYVCRVSYVPIAGHKPGKQGADYATGNTGIEVWLVPLPEAGLLVPYYVHVPTPAGTASMVTAKFDVETPGGRHAAAD